MSTTLGLGTAPIANLYHEVAEDVAVSTIQAALDCGYGHIDTAPYYGRGLAETRVGLALRGVPRTSYRLSTKVGRIIENGEARFDFSRDGVVRSLSESFARLGVDHVDIAFVHDPDEHEAEVLATALPALIDLKEQGAIGAIGVGMNAWPMLQRFAAIGGFDAFLLAGRYTLLEQGALPLLDTCHRLSIEIVLGGVFNSGILATGAVADAHYNYAAPSAEIVARVERLRGMCTRHVVPLSAAAMQFGAAHPAVKTLLVGVASPEEAAANAAGFARPIPAEFWEALRDEGFIDPATPLPARLFNLTI